MNYHGQIQGQDVRGEGSLYYPAPRVNWLLLLFLGEIVVRNGIH